jgi:hypothetical protein
MTAFKPGGNRHPDYEEERDRKRCDRHEARAWRYESTSRCSRSSPSSTSFGKRIARQLAPSGGLTRPSGPRAEEQTPEEQIDNAYRQLRSALAAQLLDRVKE